MSCCLCDGPTVENGATVITIKNATNQVQEVAVTASFPFSKTEFFVKGTINAGDQIVIPASYFGKNTLYRISSKNHQIEYFAEHEGVFFTASLYSDGWVIANSNEPIAFTFKKDLHRGIDVDLSCAILFPNGARGTFKLPQSELSYVFNLPYISDKRSDTHGLFEITAYNPIDAIHATARFKTDCINSNKGITAFFTYNSTYFPKGHIRISAG